MRLARPCTCARPMWDGDSCVRCGRTIHGAPEQKQTPWRAAPRKSPWTRAGVTRAIRAFVFFRGRAPLIADWGSGMGPDWPTLQAVEQLFGSLSAALLAAGVIAQPNENAI
jgi:hypothetical protein